MEKMDGMSMDLTKENIEKIKELFPNVVTEGKIDFDVLRTVLGDEVDASKEKYQFTWNGKAESIKIAQAPSSATLRPCKEKSKYWDTTENLYIEGDNLEVLKQLQKTYFGKIKMIYIDPPYNTGNDFVYKDDFKDSVKNYKETTSQMQSSNPNSSGRYHSDWLSMMYPRLILARNLLAEDGVIFISIDLNEHDNLKIICDEIFGSENLIEDIIWKNKYGAGAKTVGFISAHEYILAYSKSPISNITCEFEGPERDKYTKTDDKYEKRGPYRTQPLMTNSLGDRPNLMYPIEYNGVTIYPNKQWVWSKERMEEAIRNGDVEFTPQKDGGYSVRSKSYLYDEDGNIRRGKPVSVLNGPFTQDGTDEMRKLFDGKSIFDFTKPSKLIEYLLKLEVNDLKEKDFWILDFFSGSATTAQSIMQINTADKGKRKFIMVQLPEMTDEKSTAYKEGYFSICDIGEERIRRAGDQIQKEWQEKKNEEGLLANDEEFVSDIGFKVFKLDTTNINPWDNTKEYDEQSIFDTATVFKIDRSKEDILYEIMLKYGIFDQPVSEVDINGKTMYRVGQRHMIVCLEDNIDDKDVAEIAKLQARVVVFKEDGFKDDNAKINAEYNLKKSGVEDVKCI